MANAPQTKVVPKGVTVEVSPGAKALSSSPPPSLGQVAESLKLKEDVVNSPSHYTGKRTELIDITADLPFWKANAMKYILRMGSKAGVDPAEDLAKARKYLDFGERLLKGEPVSDTLRNQIHDWENPGVDNA